MTRRCPSAFIGGLILAGVIVTVGFARAALADSTGVTIVSFSYTPETVEVSAGTTVVWTNVDPTVHTVTADDGAFNSGRLRPGQRFELTFDQPGAYPYFCEPHEYMRGTVVVVGDDHDAVQQDPSGGGTGVPTPPAGGTTATPTTALAHNEPAPAAVAGTAEPAPTTGGAAVSASASSPAADAPTVVESATTSPGRVSGARVLGTSNALPPLPVATALLVLAVAAALQLLATGRVTGSTAGALVASALTLVSALVHLQLRLATDYPEPMGTLLVAQSASGAVLAAYLLRPTRAAICAAIGLQCATVAAFAASRTIGLFGFNSIGWDPSPQSALSTAAAVGVLILLGPGVLASIRAGQSSAIETSLA